MDIRDALIHAVIALVAALLVGSMGLPVLSAVFFVIAVNFWFARELYQQAVKGKPTAPWHWSAQKHAEWFAPSIASLAVFL